MRKLTVNDQIHGWINVVDSVVSGTGSDNFRNSSHDVEHFLRRTNSMFFCFNFLVFALSICFLTSVSASLMQTFGIRSDSPRVGKARK